MSEAREGDDEEEMTSSRAQGQGRDDAKELGESGRTRGSGRPKLIWATPSRQRTGSRTLALERQRTVGRMTGVA